MRKIKLSKTWLSGLVRKVGKSMNRLRDDYSCELASKYIAGFFVFILLQLLISASIFYVVKVNGHKIQDNGQRLGVHADKLDKGPRFTSEDWAKHQAILTNRIAYLETAMRDHMITCTEEHTLDDFVKPDSVHFDYIRGDTTTNKPVSGVP